MDRTFDELLDRIRSTKSVLAGLKSKGFDEGDFRASYELVLRGEIKETRVWAEALKERVADQQKNVSQSFADLSKEHSRLEARVSDFRKDLSQTLAGYGAGDDYGKRLGLLQIELQRFERVSEDTRKLSLVCEIGATTDLKSLSKKLAHVHSVAKELVAVASNEKVRRESVVALISKVAAHDERVAELTPQLQRADEGIALFAKVMSDHSIDKLLKQFIDENHTRISSILLDIHAPKEFLGIESWSGQGGIRLVRNDSAKTRADLAQISTGQRSAVALAIFLTLNEKLKTAPPLIMFDDPVAHVDDLNMLAFVDYLREIAITGTRQVFLATASDKVGAIFDQKFAGLRPDFQRITLSR